MSTELSMSTLWRLLPALSPDPDLVLMPEVPWWGAELLPVPEPSRVAFAGCWHAREDLARERLEEAHRLGAQIVVHTGDFMFTGLAASRMVMAVEETARRLGLFVIVVRGNHDDPALFRKAATATRRRNRGQVADPFARISPHVLHAPNGLRWTWRGVEFAALGGAYSVDRKARSKDVTYWEGEVPSRREINAVKNGGPTDVLITHDVPDGRTLPLPVRRPGWWDIETAEQHRSGLWEAVEAVRPDWVISGHMHMRHTWSAWLPPVTPGEWPQQVRLEVLDQASARHWTRDVHPNLMVADLVDGQVVPA